MVHCEDVLVDGDECILAQPESARLEAWHAEAGEIQADDVNDLGDLGSVDMDFGGAAHHLVLPLDRDREAVTDGSLREDVCIEVVSHVQERELDDRLQWRTW